MATRNPNRLRGSWFNSKQKRNIIAAAASLVATLVFYIQTLKDGGRNAGLLYTGDVLGYYWPALSKLRTLFAQHSFVALDFSSYNASSAFFLTANLYNAHPMIVLPSLFIPSSISFQQTGYWLVLILVAHAFLASYYTHRLLSDFFGFRFLLAAMAGIVFAFSLYSIGAQFEPPFILSIAVMPWAAYATLSWTYQPSIRTLLWGCLPIICAVLGGYGPLGLLSAAVTLGILMSQIVLDERFPSPSSRAKACVLGLLPTALSLTLLAPYLVSVLLFNQSTTSSTSPSLFFSAFQLADTPQAILRIFSQYYDVAVPPYYEFAPIWGLCGSCIVFIFLFGSNTLSRLTAKELLLFYICFTCYVFSVLAIYGEYSPFSNLIYNFVPVVGKMHIYQRFLYVSSFFYAVLIALMVKAIVLSRPPVATRLALLICVLLTFAASYMLVYKPALAASAGLNPSVVFELMLACLTAIVFLWPSPRATYAAITFLLFVVPLHRSYHFTQGDYTFAVQQRRAPLALDPRLQAEIVEYMKKRSAKSIVKYVDTTPFWSEVNLETFPKEFPYFVLDKIKLSSYGGFSFYLSSRAEYMRKFPVLGSKVAVVPNWNIIRAQGGDFLVTTKTQANDGTLSDIVSPQDLADALPLPNSTLLVPLRSMREETAIERHSVFDNGYFRVRPQIVTLGKDRQNIAIGTSASQSGGADAGAAIDGNTDGIFADGSVTHTGQDPYAWLDVDLGAERPIGDVVVWSRTDCCADRMNDYWLFLSSEPFPKDAKPADLARRAGIFKRHLTAAPAPSTQIDAVGRRARYIRVQLAGTEAPNNAYLSLAELQVFPAEKPAAAVAPDDLNGIRFQTNDANRISFDVSSSKPITLEYLLSGNPGLTYALNGSKVTPVERDGVLAFNLPAGENHFRIVYNDRLLQLFWIFYACYFVALILSVVVPPALRIVGAYRARQLQA